MKKTFAILIALFTFSASAWAATIVDPNIKTVTLEVPGMFCEVCPITVKHALQKVDGVSRIDVSLEKREAVVTFDDAKTSVKALEKATADAGYPSSVRK